MNTETQNTFGSFNLGGFGSNLQSASAKPANVPDSEATNKAPETKPLEKLPDTQTIKPAQAETEGMATRFEDVYLRVSKDIEKLSKIGKKLSQVLLESDHDMKTATHLNSQNTQWKLSDIEALVKILDGLNKDVEESQTGIEDATQAIRFIVAEIAKLLTKREDMKDVLNKSIASTTNKLNQKELGVEARSELDLLESRVDAFSTMIGSLELSVLENTKRSKFQEEDLSSYYSFNKKISEFQNELNSKDKKLIDLEEKIAQIRLADISKKARQSSAGFSCVDLSDSEEDEEEKKDASAAIQYTTKRVRRFNFFNTLYESTSQRTPLFFNKQD